MACHVITAEREEGDARESETSSCFNSGSPSGMLSVILSASLGAMIGEWPARAHWPTKPLRGKLQLRRFKARPRQLSLLPLF